MADKNFIDLLNQLDSCIFTGDAFDNEENIEDLEDCICRWRTAIKLHQEAHYEEEE